jgi:crotonobetaine/carnitine-CoA ligase
MIVRAKAPWGLNLGYYKMDEESDTAWRNGWFHTGDVLTYDNDGHYYFRDRLKDTIRRRGENISSFEVEQFVLEHPAVRECAAVGVLSPLGDEEILVAVITEEAVPFEPAELTDYLSGTMPLFMLPRYVDVLADLPRSETTGRVRKQDLRDRGLPASVWDRLR